jgi:hypothetical protein
MVAGDTAGLALLSSPYAWIGLVKTTEGTTLQTVHEPKSHVADSARNGPLAASASP